MNTQIETTETTAAARQTLLAIRCLDHRMRVLETDIAAARKRWADELKSSTAELNERIRAPVPLASSCLGALTDIQKLDKARSDQEKEKSTELDTLKQKLAETRGTFYELLRSTRSPDQVNLNFSGSGDNFDPHAGLLLSTAHLDNVREAIDGFAKDAGDEVDGMGDLTDRLTELGVAGLEFPADIEGDGDDASGGDDDDCDETEPETIAS